MYKTVINFLNSKNILIKNNMDLEEVSQLINPHKNLPLRMKCMLVGNSVTLLKHLMK